MMFCQLINVPSVQVVSSNLSKPYTVTCVILYLHIKRFLFAAHNPGNVLIASCPAESLARQHQAKTEFSNREISTRYQYPCNITETTRF